MEMKDCNTLSPRVELICHQTLICETTNKYTKQSFKFLSKVKGLKA
jgi:hypothetical protein